MKKLLKVLLIIFGAGVLIVAAVLAYLNFVYLPLKVKSAGPAFLEAKTKGRVLAESIRYIPFKGLELKEISVISPAKEPILNIDKLYFNINLWPLIIQRKLDFRLDVYPPKVKKPLIIKGLYQTKTQRLDLNCAIKNKLFLKEQTIYGKINAFLNKEKEPNIDLNLASSDLNIQGNLYMKDNDLHIEKFSGEILQSSFEFFGDVQNLAKPSLNIYGNLDLNLASLKGINPKYSKLSKKVNINGRCLGEIYISEELNNPQIGLKMKAKQIQIENSQIDDLSIISKMENKKVFLSKCYAKLYDGEANLQGTLTLDSPDLPANLNVNIFSLRLNKLIKDITGKDTPIYGQLFSLARLQGSLKNPKACQGKVWLSATSSNILQLPVLKGVSEVLRLPQLHAVRFKEASGNFTVAQQAIKTADFKIASDNMVIYFKGSMDFAGNLGFDVQPNFSPVFLSAPNIGNILGIFTDSSTGNFLGEIKLKGNIREPRYTFKPFSKDKILPRGIEEGLKQLFKLKKEEE